MNSPTASSLSSLAGKPSQPGAKRLTVAVLAYASAISASVGAAAALVGTGVPLDVLVAGI